MEQWAIAWRPGIGDPTIGGWITVVLYFVAAWGAWRVLRHSSELFTHRLGRQRALWLVLWLALIFLGVNKQLDLQSLMTDIGRVLAKQQGWYQDRKQVQAAFIVAVLMVALMVTALLVWLYRRTLLCNGLAIVGFVVLMAFIMVRATSFHGSDVLIHSRLMGLKINWLLECGGLLLIVANEWLLLRNGDQRELQERLQTPK